MMAMTNRPTKEEVRQWLTQRLASNDPLPEIEQIQRALGWKAPPDMYAACSKPERRPNNEVLECFSEA